VPARSWLYTCVVPVSARCANAHLLSYGGDLVPEKNAFVLVLHMYIYFSIATSRYYKRMRRKFGTTDTEPGGMS
jgi:hypothetical protein